MKEKLVNKEKVRLDYLDIAKGIGIFLVVFYHCMIYAPSVFSDSVKNMISSFFMPLFFFLSGYLYKVKPTRDYLYGKTKSLLIPLILIYLYNYYITIISAIINLDSDLFKLKGYWFLEDLLVISVLYYFVNCFLLKHKFIKEKCIIYILFAFSVIVSLFAILLEYLSGGGGSPSINSAAASVVFFSFGHIFRTSEVKFDIKQNRIVLLILGIILLIGTGFLSQYCGNISIAYNKYGNPPIFVLCAIMGTIGILFISKAMKHSHVLAYFGRNSLVMITTQFPIICCGNIVFNYISENIINLNMFLFTICNFVFTLICEVLVITIINKFLPIFAGKPKYEIE